MTIFHQAAACAPLLILTLWIQCAGVAALIEWLKRVMARVSILFAIVTRLVDAQDPQKTPH
jgi:hypothetical protein